MCFDLCPVEINFFFKKQLNRENDCDSIMHLFNKYCMKKSQHFFRTIRRVLIKGNHRRVLIKERKCSRGVEIRADENCYLELGLDILNAAAALVGNTLLAHVAFSTKCHCNVPVVEVGAQHTTRYQEHCLNSDPESESEVNMVQNRIESVYHRIALVIQLHLIQIMPTTEKQNILPNLHF